TERSLDEPVLLDPGPRHTWAQQGERGGRLGRYLDRRRERRARPRRRRLGPRVDRRHSTPHLHLVPWLHREPYPHRWVDLRLESGTPGPKLHRDLTYPARVDCRDISSGRRVHHHLD